MLVLAIALVESLRMPPFANVIPESNELDDMPPKQSTATIFVSSESLDDVTTINTANDDDYDGARVRRMVDRVRRQAKKKRKDITNQPNLKITLRKYRNRMMNFYYNFRTTLQP